MFKTILVMMIAITAATVGDILLAKGMKELGDISTMNLRAIFDTALRAVVNPKLVCGTLMMVVFFFLWLVVLSWEDVSVAVPMQAFSYVLVAILAKYYLNEQVSSMRWAGIILVSIGVMMITSSISGESASQSVITEKTHPGSSPDG